MKAVASAAVSRFRERVKLSKLSGSTASKPLSAQPSIHSLTLAATRLRLAGVRDVEQRLVPVAVDDDLALGRRAAAGRRATALSSSGWTWKALT